MMAQISEDVSEPLKESGTRMNLGMGEL